MDVFNIIVGVASIVSCLISIFVATMVIKITNNLKVTVDSSNNVKQRVSGKGNNVSGGNMNNV